MGKCPCLPTLRVRVLHRSTMISSSEGQLGDHLAIIQWMGTFDVGELSVVSARTGRNQDAVEDPAMRDVQAQDEPRSPVYPALDR